MAKLKKLFTNLNPQKIANMKVAALCFLAAATFWVLNALNKGDYNTIVDYPIEIVFDETEFMPVEQLPNRMKIEINGNGWDLLRKYFKINESPFLIEINNPSTKDYILTSELRRTLADNLSPSALVSIVTDTVKFKIDKVVTRKVKIEADTTSATLASNARLGSDISIDPPFVDIKGPTSVLQELDGVLKVKLGEDKINKNFNKLIPLALPSAYTDFLTLEDESVQVKFEVFQMLEGNKRLKIKMLNFPKNVGLAQEPSNIIMSYFIDERKVAELSKYEFEAILNYNNRDKEDSTIFVELRPKASFLEKIKFEPEVLKLKYDKP
ncbi:YbbR-like domain-containing protein [Aquiflexum sp. TKW24L]|uniref:YbbR-like domain-containing protein n=1 Tax=Aquiflexum sp. TKW24L TaxID=2942212 RepID=UPI0020BEC5DB|nr:YbbR-like domain-containing protein [Aquiflexum sp. TKW24L]MCL6258673.1 YbbR-like domain-containing protein [Aquiflexum sp. TKW24L]